MSDCRFYEREYPEVNQLVMVQVKRVADTSAYVTLLEYKGIEGMILLSEVSTRRIRSMLKEIRAGQFAVCLVLRVEKDKGYIDLSRRRVNAEERARYLRTYARSKLVHSTLRQLSAAHDVAMPTLCEKISWPLYASYSHAADAFNQFINDKDPKIFDTLDISAEMKKDLFSIIEKKLTPTAMKLKAKIEVSCYETEGIEAVKAALMAGLEGNKDLVEDPLLKVMGKIAIKVVAPPHYEVITESIGKETGVKAIEAALGRIEKTILDRQGRYNCTSKPEAVDGEDEIIDRDLESEGEASEESDEDQEGMGDFQVDESAFKA